MIRDCTDADLDAICRIINEAARAYRGVIPPDCWHEPYMSRSHLVGEIASGVRFSGFDDDGALVGVMGTQTVRDATLIRHAYVRLGSQRHGVGSALMTEKMSRTTGPLLVGTWAAAAWAIRFYERHGFRVVPAERVSGREC